MNFYKHHIGDYDADTSHLTWDEDMAYTRMIRAYYRREKPLPVDTKEVCRLVRAVTKMQRDAVQTVLNEFFILGDDGWHQKRCDGEIAAANKKADENRANGKKGGRPRKEETKQEPTKNPDGFYSENHNGSSSESEKNLSQTPDSRLQTPDIAQQHNHGGQSRAPLGDGDDPPERHIAVAVLLRNLGVKPMTGQHPHAMLFANTGATDAQLRAAVEIARERKPLPQDIPPAYLEPILADVLKPRESIQAKQPQDSWWASDAGIDRKGRELGMAPLGTESYAAYKDRIFAKIRERKEAA